MNGYTEWDDYGDEELDDLVTVHRDSVAAHKAEADRLWGEGHKREACRHYLAAGECLEQARGVEAERDRRGVAAPIGVLPDGGERRDDGADGWSPRSLEDVLFDD